MQIVFFDLIFSSQCSGSSSNIQCTVDIFTLDRYILCWPWPAIKVVICMVAHVFVIRGCTSLFWLSFSLGLINERIKRPYFIYKGYHSTSESCARKWISDTTKNLSPLAQLTDLIIHLITMLLGVLNCDEATFRLKATNSQQFLFYFNILWFLNLTSFPTVRYL